jgi:hypothetical protein
MGRLEIRAEEARRLQGKVLQMQERALDLAGRAEEAAAAAERLRGRRAAGPPGGFDGGARARGAR